MSGLSTHTLVLLVCSGAACSASTTNRPGDADTDKSDGHEILDVEDRCPIIIDCEEGFIDYDGCPDVILVFERNTTELVEKHLELVGELAEEIKTRKKVRKLRIDGHFAAGEAEDLGAQRAQTVRDRLVSRGISTAMLEIRTDKAPDGSSGFVSFFPLQCDR